MSEASEAELLEILAEDARLKSDRERIPADWKETLAMIRRERAERPQPGPRNSAIRTPKTYRCLLDLEA